MSPQLRERLSYRFVSRLCTDRIEIHRSVLDQDGMGGQTMTWRKIATIPARLVNKSDMEALIGDGVKATATWECFVHSSADVRPHDRIYLVGDPERTFDVIGNDQGQSELLIQKVGLVERYA